MTAITQALSAALLHFVWQGLLVGLVLWIALFLMRKGPANARYAASCAALVILVLLPVVTACNLYAPITAAGPVKTPSVTSLAVRAARTSSEPWPAAWLAATQAWALPLWSLGVLAFSLRLVLGSKQVAMLRRRGAPADAAIVKMVAGLGKRMGLARPVRVLITTLADGPSVVGWIRPVILLPSATLLGLTPEQLEAVLAHEIAHIRRYDYLVNILQIVAETLLFYHPAVWWASARIRHERELCCDDLAVRSCGDALCYARALTALEKLRVLTPNLAMGSTGGSLIYRIQRLMGETTRECGPSKLSGALTLLLGLTCFLLNVHWAQGQADAIRPSDLAIAPSASQVRDASGVAVELGGAAVLHREPVNYPKTAAERRIEGTVVVEVTLDARGEASDARVLSGPAELRKAALESVLNWHFMPGGAGTRQVSIVFHVPSEAEGSSARESAEAEQKVSGNQIFFYSRREAGNGGEEIAKREAELNELKAKILDFQQRQADGNLLEETQRKLADAERGLENARSLNESPAGKAVKNILVLGLPDQAVKALQSRLPVHIGDTLTHESIEEIGRAVRAFDEHLEYILMPAEDGPGVALVITTPDEGDWRVRRE
jgi:TonB family protein